MTEVEMLVLSIVFFVVTLSFFVFILIVLKNRKRYFETILSEIEYKTKEYFMSIGIEDDRLFPFNKEVVAGITRKFNKIDYDELTNIKLKKGYTFIKQRVIFIVNNELNYPFKIVNKNNKEYMVIDDSIKQIEILVSSYRPSHYMLKYTFTHENNRIAYEVEEVKYDE